MKEPASSEPAGLAAKVMQVADLVNYQDGSIVSRQIVRKPTGTVTVFAFDGRQGLSEHTAPFDALVHPCTCSKSKRRSALPAGRTICRPAT